ncbi:lipid kinase YegS [Roseibium sp. CAU 1637]|uniref:Lipid kinase YegS n=1 Tax=Roseibium limicola TaxID=2816037 RepID=A0A939EPT8_9HYPH|nr:lipid kinase YegS [Roseibium limicola]MBO0346377.1 lipid kinase YegS [Roseibium limicola]
MASETASTSNIRIILHGKASAREDIRLSIAKLREQGHHVSVRVTYEAGDTARLAREAVQEAEIEAIDVLVAGGGDGTLNEVAGAVCAVTDGAPPFDLAVLPLGTANDFARSIGIDPADIDGCLRYAAEGTACPLDIGRVNSSYFVNMATGGFGARVTAETDPRLKKLFGGVSYLFAGLQRVGEMSACSGRITADGFDWQGNFVALALGNGRQAGGGVQLCPNAKFDDGLIDLALLPVPESGEVSELFGELVEGGPEGLRRRMITHRAASFLMEGDEDLQLNLDGEPLKANRFEIAVLPGALNFRRP